MSTIARTDTSILGRWWWTVDRWTLGALFLLVLIGALLVMAASPPVAERINLDGLYFVRRQFMILPVALLVMIGVSLMTPLQVRRFCCLGLAVTLTLLLLVPLIGTEIKGAHRWIGVGGVTIQPSEFAKPFFAVVSAWMFAEWRRDPEFPGHIVPESESGRTVTDNQLGIPGDRLPSRGHREGAFRREILDRFTEQSEEATHFLITLVKFTDPGGGITRLPEDRKDRSGDDPEDGHGDDDLKERKGGAPAEGMARGFHDSDL